MIHRESIQTYWIPSFLAQSAASRKVFGRSPVLTFSYIASRLDFVVRRILEVPQQ
jgi:hypothetical protein